MTKQNTKSDTSISIMGCGYIGKLLAQRLQQINTALNAYVCSNNSLDICKRLNITSEIVDLDKPVSNIDHRNQSVIYLVPPPPTGKVDKRISNYLSAIKQQNLKKLVLISTTGVYGDCNGDWVNESAPIKPVADRAYRRADAEQQAISFCQKNTIPLLILRVPGIYGPGKIPLRRIKSGQPIVREQDSPYTNRIHALDLVRICEIALNTSLTGIYNVSDGHPGTMYEYFMGVAETMDLPAPPSITLEEAKQELSEGMLSYMAESRRIDNKKLLKDFSLVLKYPDLQAGLQNIK